MQPKNRPTTATCAAIIMGLFLLAACPPLALLVIAVGIVPQILHRDRSQRAHREQHGKAVQQLRREKILAVRSLGL